MVSICITCQPRILNQIVTQVIELMPSVRVVAWGSAAIDVIVTTSPTDSLKKIDRRAEPWPNFSLVTLDEPSNTLWVRDTTGRSAGQRVLVGDLSTLVAVIQTTIVMITHERATQLRHPA